MRKSRLFAILLTLLILLGVVTAVSAYTYTVQPGDTLYGIARQFNTTVNSILQTNAIPNPDLIFVGQQIEIPEDGGPVTPPVTPPVNPPPTAPNPPPVSDGSIYIVQPGDTLSAIARRFSTSVAAIVAANGIPNVNLIYIGQQLIIPGGTGSPPPNPPPNVPPTTPSGGFALGGQVTGLGRTDLLNQAGMTWVKFQIKWSPGDDPGRAAGIINDAHSRGYKVLLSIPGANTYPAQDSINFFSYVEFLRGVAAYKPDAIEVWNEMNIDFEWPAGQISPTSYVNNMLAPAYAAIKAVSPGTIVIGGALAPTGFDNNTNAWSDARYLDGLRAAGAGNYMDCMGMHYNAGATSPTVSTGHPADGGDRHYSWYYQPTLNLYLSKLGRDVCITELGYLSAQGYSGLSSNFSWAGNTTVGQQAQWLADAVSMAAGNGRVPLVIVFNVEFTNYDPNGDPQAGYALLRPDGSCPACSSLGAVMGR